MNCSPTHENGGYTCYSKESLVKIAKAYNASHKDKIRLKQNKSDLWYAIRKKLSSKCDTEECWADQPYVKALRNDEIDYFTFRPKKPIEWRKNKYTWLSTIEIDDVMRQYEAANKDFAFLGTVPSDCPSDIRCELSNLNIPSMFKNGIKKIAMVYNLDTHNKPGSHWVAIYGDLVGGELIYHDSYGGYAPKNITRFLHSVRDSMKASGHPMKIRYNKRRHQRGGSECSLYSIVFILSMLYGYTLKEWEKKRIPDRLMNEFRDYFFRD